MNDPSKRRAAWLLAAVVAVSLAAHAPSLGWGFWADDFGHQLVLDGRIEHESMRPWNLYDFGEAPGPGDPTYVAGGMPWWTPPDWRIRFFRPLASLSLWLDHAVFGSWAPGYHLSGCLWFAGILLAAHALYRALGLGPRTALLATLFLGLEDGTLLPVGWAANRNSLVEVLCLTCCALVLARPGSLGRWRPLVLALLLALGAALAKESGLTAFLVLGLLLLWKRRGAPRRWTAAGIGLAGLLAAGYLAWLGAWGYGAQSLFYPEPWSEPWFYVQRLAVLCPNGLFALALPYSPDAMFVKPELTLPLTLSCALLVTPMLRIAWSRVRAHAAAPFLAGWAVVTLLPQSGAPISDRLMLGPMVGAAALIAIFVEAVRAEEAPRLAPRLLAKLLLIGATLLSGTVLFVRGILFVPVFAGARNVVLEAEVGHPDLGRREVFLLNSPSEVAVISPLATWLAVTGDDGVRFWPLQLGRRPVLWTRVDARTFELLSEGAPFLTGSIEAVYLAAEPDLRAGDRWTTDLFTVEVAAVDADGLRTIRVELPANLDSPSYRFLAWRDGALRLVAPPAIGETLRFAQIERLWPLFP